MVCDACGGALASSAMGKEERRYTFREHGGRKYCEHCYASSVAPACARCRRPIVDTVTSAMGKNWHPACLTCSLCDAQLQSSFYLLDHKPGQPFCSFCIKGVQQQTALRHPPGSLGTLPGTQSSGFGSARMYGFQ
jgi:hypothetical protein